MEDTKKLITLLLLTASGMIISGCGNNMISEDSNSDAKPIVGVYYYPWYHNLDNPYPHLDNIEIVQSVSTTTSWRDNFLRNHLIPAHAPELGFYNSYNRDVIGKHIEQSVRGNISFWPRAGGDQIALLILY